MARFGGACNMKNPGFGRGFYLALSLPEEEWQR